ncbi:EF-hand domain-containing protein [Streptomyces sp. NPDC048496]|uniref:EF-hand domain-containing protein n=1 Tax=Streptomyces sp. NPDC048496 TaxID=3365558 RepID=UPI003719CE4B
MAENTIATKLDKLFDATDTNADGYVEWADYQRVVDRLLSGFKVDKGSLEGQALIVTYQMFWAEVRRHANGQERLSKDAFVAAVNSVMVDTSRFNLIEGVPHAIFDVIDTDDDGGISHSEWQQLATVLGISAPEVKERFVALDRDGDGSISRQELLRSWREFFYGEDSYTTGGLILGVL